MKSVKVAVVGCGTIGTGVCRLLIESEKRISRAAGRPVELVAVVDKDTSPRKDVCLPDGLMTDDLSRVTDDPRITAVVQLIGGLEPARTVMLKLLAGGKDVITANKALLAEHGPELFEAARRAGRSIAFEAAVAGGVPIIAALGSSLAGNRIESIHAILNGTSNFILSRMDQEGTDYAASVAEAQRLGLAEADPTMDVDGTDAAQKLAILAHLAFGADVDWKRIPRAGIDSVEVADLRYANELGYTVKLLAVARLEPQGLELFVCPTLVRHHTMLAEVDGAYNAIRVVGDPVGRVFFHGLGAGRDPTSSAVVGDLIDTIVGRAAITFQTLGLWSEGRETSVEMRDPAQAPSRFYLRFNVEDRPGVLSEIAGILGKHQISIASVIQHETEEKTDVIAPLVIMTHNVPEGAVSKALATIDELACVRPRTICMRVRG